jgi:hypothetical protein
LRNSEKLNDVRLPIFPLTCLAICQRRASLLAIPSAAPVETMM